MKTLVIYLCLLCTLTAGPIVKKYNGLFMPISEQSPDLYYLLLNGQTIIGEDVRVKLDDEDFVLAINETKTNKIYQLRTRGGMLTHNAIDSIKGQDQLRYLDLSNNKLITDLACKKIALYFPRLERLNLFNTGISNKGLTYLIDLQELKQLHVGLTDVTWDVANEFRGKMESIGGNDDLEITTGFNKPALGSIKHGKFLRATYQSNVIAGQLNPNFKVGVADEPAKSNEKYEE
tara:strand:+ start:644 stop:1342 length:699 start_codon:yes stop_codon:yes gene_type:complete